MSQTDPQQTAPEPAPAAGLPKPRPRRLWLTLLLTAVVFVAGIVVGGGGALIVVRNRLVEAIQHPQLEPARITTRLRRSLELDDEQAAQVEAILQRHQAELQEIRRRVQPEVVARLDLVEQEVGDVLTPEQRQRWHTQLDRLRRTWIPPMPDEPESPAGAIKDNLPSGGATGPIPEH
jgi:hypothetical protein